jgi:hypothetical protein
MKVREDTGGFGAREQFAMLRDGVPAHPCAAHPGVDLQVPGTCSASPRLDHRRVAERRRQVGTSQRIDLRAQDRCEDDDRSRDAAAAQFVALGDRRHPVAPRVERVERHRRAQPAESVAVSLHHGQQGHARACRHGSPVSAQSAQVDLDPGACHGTALFAIMWRLKKIRTGEEPCNKGPG